MRPKVDFLGIGAQKSATTWLDENLRKHPDIWMPPIKELHYFDRLPESGSGEKIRKRSFINTYKKKLKKRENRKPIFKRALETIFKEPSTIYWLYKYFYKNPGDSWYLDLFKPGKNRIKGEITPEYSILNDEKIKHIKNVLPDAKIIFLIRNPIDRCWSQFRFEFKKNPLECKNYNDIIKNFIERHDQKLRGNYIEIINKWLNHYSDENFFIGYFDDVQKNPEKIYRDITKFLGATRDYLPADLRKKVLVSNEYPIPAEIKYHLAKKYRPQLEELSRMLGGHTSNWLKEAEQILNTAE